MKLPFDRDEGVVCAWIPVLNSMGDTVGECVAYDGMLVDAHPNAQPYKWWRVKSAARDFKLSHPEPIWTGPAEEFRVESLPGPNRRHENLQLAVRSYHSGPWVTLGEEHEPKAIVK